MKTRLPICPLRAHAATIAALLAGLAAAAPATAASEPTGASGEAAESGRSAPAAPRAAHTGRCRANIEVGAEQVLAGETVTVSGTLRCPEGTEAGGQTVTLLAHTPKGERGFAEVATATSEPGGSYRMQSPALEENTIFLVRLAARGHSPRRRVAVEPRVSLLAPLDGARLAPASRDGSQAATNTVAFSGVVTPASPNELVVLQRESPTGSGRWRRTAVAHVDESGHYAITHTFRRPGRASVRIVVHSDGALTPAVSQTLIYTIEPLARPQRASHIAARRLPRG